MEKSYLGCTTGNPPLEVVPGQRKTHVNSYRCQTVHRVKVDPGVSKLPQGNELSRYHVNRPLGIAHRWNLLVEWKFANTSVNFTHTLQHFQWQKHNVSVNSKPDHPPPPRASLKGFLEQRNPAKMPAPEQIFSQIQGKQQKIETKLGKTVSIQILISH